MEIRYKEPKVFIGLAFLLHIILSNMIDLASVFSYVPKYKKGKGKKILIFNWRDTKHVFAGGAENYIHEMAKRWVLAGDHVTLFCGNDGHNPRNEVVDGVQVIRRGGFYFVYVWAFIYYALRLRGRYDLIIDCQNGIPFFTPLYSRENIVCLMFHVHQKVFMKTLPKHLAYIASNLERFMPRVYRNTDFITISESSRKDMIELGFNAEKITVIHPGVDLKNMRPAVKAKAPTVLYLGRLKEYKSVHLFIEAAVKVRKQIPNAQFIIAGDGDERFNLIKLSKELGMHKEIKFLGKVTEEEKVDLYQKAWVFVNPSYMEGWGMTSIEANACGTPVVASDVPGLRDSVNNPETGFLFKYGDVAGMADKITEILMDDKKRKFMSEKSIQWAKTFDWSVSAKKGMRLI